MSKYHTITVYYPEYAKVGDGPLGRYIHELFESGMDAIQIIKAERPHSHEHQLEMPTEPIYTNVQGNVGSS